MPKSVLLDKGTEDMYIYPQIEATDKRGNTIELPSDTPVKIRVSTSIDQGSDAELAGQVSVKVLRVITRHAPLESWARIVYAGEEWDLAYPPRQTPGVSRATRHTEFGIRSRNTENTEDYSEVPSYLP